MTLGRKLRVCTGAAVVLLLSTGVAGASGPAPTRTQAIFEIDFMQDMIDHHAMAIMMSEMCLEKAMHPELLSLCQQIITAQRMEIELMQGWLLEWYGIAYEPEMKKGDMKRMQRMMQLSPEEFEIAFMEMMIRHHWKAVVEARVCVDRAYHTELVAMCQNIAETQTAEIEQMQAWLCEWYGICRSGPQPA